MFEAQMDLELMVECDAECCGAFYCGSEHESFDRAVDAATAPMIYGFWQSLECQGWDIDNPDDVRCPKCACLS